MHRGIRGGSLWHSLVACLLWSLSGPGQAAVAEVKPGLESFALAPYLEYLADPTQNLTIADVTWAPVTDRFLPNQNRVFNAGFTDVAYWYRVTLRQSGMRQPLPAGWFMEIGFPLLDHLDVYLPDEDGGWQVLRMGDQLPFSSRPVDHRNFVVPLQLPADRQITVYLRVKTKSAHVLPLTLWSSQGFYKRAQNDLALLGGYYGVMLVLIVYNLFVFASLRERVVLDYVLFVIFFGVLTTLSLNGLGPEYFWGESPWWTNVSAPLHINLGMLWILCFAQSFLQTRHRMPVMHKLLQLLQASTLIGVVLALLVDYATSVRLGIANVVLVSIAVPLVTLRALWLGLRPVRMLLAASAVYIFFNILQIAQVSDLLPAHAITTYFVQIGMALGVVLLSLALADRAHLERRQRELLFKQRERAEAQNLAKSEFLAKMSHEIRTPMNAIVGFADLALRADKEPKRLEFLSNIRIAAESLLLILSDILDLSKIEAGKLRLERKAFRVQAVVERLAVLFAQRAAEKGVELVLSAPPRLPELVLGDALRLEQVLVNFTNNALKFTERGEVEVEVTQEFLSAESATLRFSVRDTGIGLAPEQCAQLFQPFSQGDESTTRQYGGTGLGLSICKQLVELMGGRIGVDSTLGSGSTFWCSIPFTLPEPGASRSTPVPASAPEGLRGLRALVVDDSATARKAYSGMLHTLGVEAESVNNGEDAVGRFAAKPYDLVLMDWRMPGIDGIETSRRIRSLPGGEFIPIIMITVHPREELSRNVEPGLVNASLGKPVTPSEMLDTLSGLFDLGGAARNRTLPGLAETLGAEKLRGAQVLLVEDNPMNQRMATEILQGLGLSVDVASNGAEGVARVDQKPYAAVLMDMQMPVMDGLQATRLIREQPRHARLPIIAITANVLPRDRQRCLQAGMNDFLSKPIELDHLIRVLGKWLGPIVGSPPRERVETPVPASIPAAEPSSGTPAINRMEGLERANGNRKLYRELLQIFREHHAADADKIRAALARGDRIAAHHLAHTLKGVAGNLAMPQLRVSALRLEACLEGEGAVPEALLAQFEQAFAGVTTSLGSLLAELSNG